MPANISLVLYDKMAKCYVCCHEGFCARKCFFLIMTNSSPNNIGKNTHSERNKSFDRRQYRRTNVYEKITRK